MLVTGLSILTSSGPGGSRVHAFVLPVSFSSSTVSSSPLLLSAGALRGTRPHTRPPPASLLAASLISKDQDSYQHLSGEGASPSCFSPPPPSTPSSARPSSRPPLPPRLPPRPQPFQEPYSQQHPYQAPPRSPHSFRSSSRNATRWVEAAHINGTALPPQDYLILKDLVRRREAMQARAFCFSLLEDSRPLSVHSYLTLMKNLGRAGDWEGAVGIFEALRLRHQGVGGKEFMKLIRVLARAGQYEAAMAYWDKAEALGLGPPSILDFNKLFDILGRAKQWPRCRSLYEKMFAMGVRPNKSTYQVLAHSAAVSAPWSEVLRILDAATLASCASNYVFTMALKGLKVRRNWKAAWALIQEMRERWHITPDTVTYTAAISACERSSNCTVALSLVALMEVDGAHPNQYTYSAAISACGRGGRLDEAKRLWGEMKSRGLRPNLVVYNTMLSACERGGDVDAAFDLLEEMRAAGIDRDVITWNTLISVCKERGEWERALGCLRDMQTLDRVEPDTISFNAAIAACARGGAVEEGRRLLGRMKAQDVDRDTCTYNTLMDGYTRAGSFPDVLHVLDQMGKEGGRARPDVISYTQALSAAEKVGDYEAADRLLAAMKVAGIRWNQYTYAVVMALCEKTGRWPQALHLLHSMRRRGLTPDSTCYTVVVKACASAQKLGHCLALLERMQNDGVVPTIHIYTILVGAALMKGKAWTAVGLYHDMLARGVRPNGVFVSAVIHALLEGGGSQVGGGKLEEEGKEGEGEQGGNREESVRGRQGRDGQALIRSERWVDGPVDKAGSPGGKKSSRAPPTLSTGRTRAKTILTRMEREVRRAQVVAGAEKRPGETEDPRSGERAVPWSGQGVCLDRREYHVLLRAICRKGHLAFAHEILQHMVRVHLPPDVTAYNYLVLGYAARGNAAATNALVREMHRKGVEPNVFTFINLVRACTLAGCPEKALSVVDPAFSWDFYSAAITIYHQSGCFAEADALYQQAVLHGKVPVDVTLTPADHALDLHGMSAPVAAAAVRYALKRIREEWWRCGPAAVKDLVLISGVGKGSLVPFRPTLRPAVQDMLVEQYYPPIDSTTQPGNAGRVVVGRESLLAWLEGKEGGGQSEGEGGGEDQERDVAEESMSL